MENESLIFLEQKLSGTVKSRFCADGRKQWKDVSQEDTSSTNVISESVLFRAAIDADEEQDVALLAR